MTHPAGVLVSWVTALGSLVEGLTHRKVWARVFLLSKLKCASGVW